MVSGTSLYASDFFIAKGIRFFCSFDRKTFFADDEIK